MTPRASVRAMTTKSGSRFAATAARILAANASGSTSDLPDRWPQLFGRLLVFEVNPRGAGGLEFGHRPLDVQHLSEARIGIT